MFQAARIQEMRTPTPDGGFDEDPMFGEDVLVIQRTAPDLTHLTIIDIPGKCPSVLAMSVTLLRANLISPCLVAMFENDFAASKLLLLPLISQPLFRRQY